MAMLKRLTSLVPITSYRFLHLSSVRSFNPKDVKEIQIPVPWGHIAGRWWGDENKRPILAVHGWLDNAGTFDVLMEHFPKTQPVLAIDFPGHGLSSHLPPGQVYSNQDDSALIRRLQKYYNWDKVTILGHSRGSEIAMIFAAMYPNDIDYLLSLDLVMPFYIDKVTLSLGKLIDSQLESLSRNPINNVEYTEDEIKSRWIKATRGSLNEDSVTVLMKRGVKRNPQSGKFYFTRDSRLKSMSLQIITPEMCRNIVKKITCHYLFIKFNQSFYFKNSLKYVPDILDVAKMSKKSFEIHSVDGNHHTHMDTPEVVVPIITKFLERV